MEHLAHEIDRQVQQVLARLLSDNTSVMRGADEAQLDLNKTIETLDAQLAQLHKDTAEANPRALYCEEITRIRTDIEAKQITLTRCQRRLGMLETELERIEKASREVLTATTEPMTTAGNDS